MDTSTSTPRPANSLPHLVGILLAALAAFSLNTASAHAVPGQAHAAERKAISGSKRTHRTASTSRQRGKGKLKAEPTLAPAPAPESSGGTTTDPAPVPDPAPAPAPGAGEPAPSPQPTPAPEGEPVPAPEPAPEPAPAPAPAPAPSPSLLFNGTEIGDFWINHSAPGAITETTDPAGSGQSTIKMSVSDRDVYPITPTENPRAEILSPALIKPGMEFWLATKFFVPPNYPTISSSGWVSLVSVYGAPFNGPSPWRLELSGNNLQWQRNETYGYDVPFQIPLQRGKWIEVVSHERFGSNGFVEMWIDGKAVTFFGSGTYNPHRVAPTEHLQMATMDASNNGDSNSAKIMQYRKAGMFSNGTIYFGPLRVGATENAVEN